MCGWGCTCWYGGRNGVGGGGGEGGGKLGSMSCDELKVGTMSNGLNEGYD